MPDLFLHHGSHVLVIGPFAGKPLLEKGLVLARALKHRGSLVEGALLRLLGRDARLREIALDILAVGHLLNEPDLELILPTRRVRRGQPFNRDELFGTLQRVRGVGLPEFERALGRDRLRARAGEFRVAFCERSAAAARDAESWWAPSSATRPSRTCCASATWPSRTWCASASLAAPLCANAASCGPGGHGGVGHLAARGHAWSSGSFRAPVWPRSPERAPPRIARGFAPASQPDGRSRARPRGRRARSSPPAAAGPPPGRAYRAGSGPPSGSRSWHNAEPTPAFGRSRASSSWKSATSSALCTK